jgi:aspartyl aminopeptidase
MTHSIANQLCDYIAKSPTPFHATENLINMFIENGFKHLDESDDWGIESSKAYVVTRNNSSIIAFRTGSDYEQGFQMLGAHTDSPCLRIKPNPEIKKHGYTQLGVEVYGGALLHPWLDRELSIAGRVSGVANDGSLFHQLIDFERPIAIIPNLAIHLDRDANNTRVINPQNHLPIIIGQGEDIDFKQLLLEQLAKQGYTDAQQVLEFELSCYDVQAPSLVGLKQEFVCASRIDNLLSTYIGARAILDTNTDQASLFISTDHEEVGSSSTSGAQGTFLKSVLQRLTDSPAAMTQLIARSTMVSCDNAHGLHPNYADKHDQNHGPILNSGPVIKINSNQRYASNSISSAKFKQICDKLDIPVQTFVTRSDMGCGSTIGPVMATELGIETLDIGAPQWAMHSIRETAGTLDCEYLYRAACGVLGKI